MSSDYEDSYNAGRSGKSSSEVKDWGAWNRGQKDSRNDHNAISLLSKYFGKEIKFFALALIILVLFQTIIVYILLIFTPFIMFYYAFKLVVINNNFKNSLKKAGIEWNEVSDKIKLEERTQSDKNFKKYIIPITLVSVVIGLAYFTFFALTLHNNYATSMAILVGSLIYMILIFVMSVNPSKKHTIQWILEERQKYNNLDNLISEKQASIKALLYTTIVPLVIIFALFYYKEIF